MMQALRRPQAINTLAPIAPGSQHQDDMIVSRQTSPPLPLPRMIYTVQLQQYVNAHAHAEE